MKLDLRTIRLAAGLNLPEMAKALGRNDQGQTASDMERRTDWKVSTVAKFIAACGGEAVLTVKVNGEVLEFHL